MKKFFITLTISCLFAFFFTSCDKTEDVVSTPIVEVETPQEMPKGYRVAFTEQVTREHDLVQRFGRTQDFAQLDESRLNWEEITLAIYQNSDLQGLIIPFHTSGRVLYAMYSKGKFNSLVVEVNSDVTMTSEDEAFTGDVSLYAVDGTKLITSSYANNEFVSVEKFNLDRDPFWDCMAECIEDTFPQLPWWLQVICGTGFGGCVYAVNPAACAVLAGCLIGYIGGCYEDCSAFPPPPPGGGGPGPIPNPIPIPIQ